jgi:hypothetical protein
LVKKKAQQVLVTLLHLHGVGVLFDEDWVGDMVASNEELINSSLLW